MGNNYNGSDTGSSIGFFSTKEFSLIFYQHGFNIPAEKFINQYLITEKGVVETELTDNANLFKDLGLDSLDFISLSLCVQSFYNLKNDLQDAVANGEISPVLSEIIGYCEENKDFDYMKIKSNKIDLAFRAQKINVAVVM